MDSPVASTGIPELKDERYFIFNRALFVDIPELSDLPEQEADCPPALISFYTSVVRSLSYGVTKERIPAFVEEIVNFGFCPFLTTNT